MEQPISRNIDIMLGVLPIRVEHFGNLWRIGIKPDSKSLYGANSVQHAWCLFDGFHLNIHKATYRKLFLEKQLVNTQDWALIPIEDSQNDGSTRFQWKVGTGADECILLDDENIRAVIKLIEEFEADPAALMARLEISK